MPNITEDNKQELQNLTARHVKTVEDVSAIAARGPLQRNTIKQIIEERVNAAGQAAFQGHQGPIITDPAGQQYRSLKTEHGKAIILNEAEAVLAPAPTKLDDLLHSMNHNHPELDNDARAQIFIKAYNDYPIEPVRTPHPTNPAAMATDNRLFAVGDTLAQLEQSREYTAADHIALEQNSRKLIEERISPVDKMTPLDENEREISFWKRQMEQAPQLLQEVRSRVQEIIYNGAAIPGDVQKDLDAAIKKQMRSRAWRGDRDGNMDLQPEHMEEGILRIQQAVHELFTDHLVPVKQALTEERAQIIAKTTHKTNFDEATQHNRLKHVDAAQRALDSVQTIWAEHKEHVLGDTENRQQVLDTLNGLASNPNLSETTRQQLGKFHEIVDTVYTTGIMKIDTREDSGKYTDHMGDVYSVLRKHRGEINSTSIQSFFDQHASYPVPDANSTAAEHKQIRAQQYEFIKLLREDHNVADVLQEHQRDSFKNHFDKLSTLVGSMNTDSQAKFSKAINNVLKGNFTAQDFIDHSETLKSAIVKTIGEKYPSEYLDKVEKLLEVAIGSSKDYKLSDSNNPLNAYKSSKDDLNNATSRCIGFDLVQLKFPEELDRNITSETTHVNIVHEMAAMQSFARHFVGDKSKPFGMPHHYFMTLHENQKSLEASPDVIRGIAADPILRAAAIENGTVEILLGPSDTAKLHGIGIHPEILEARNALEAALEEVKRKDLAFAHVKLKILNGTGGDWRRMVYGPDYIHNYEIDLHQTMQGIVGRHMVRSGGMVNTVLASAGTIGQIQQRALEQKLFSEQKPEIHAATKAFYVKSAELYRPFIQSPEIDELYQAIQGEAGNNTLSASNRSSRAASKQEIATIASSRAIGGITLAQQVAINIEVTQVLAPFDHYTEEDYKNIANIDQSSSNKLLFTKVATALSTSHFDSAWEKLGEKNVDAKRIKELADQYKAAKDAGIKVEPKMTLAHYQQIQVRRLEQSTRFLPGENGQKMRQAIADFIAKDPEHVTKLHELSQTALLASGHAHVIDTVNQAKQRLNEDMKLGWNSERLYRETLKNPQADKGLLARTLDLAASAARTLPTFFPIKAMNVKSPVIWDTLQKGIKKIIKPFAYGKITVDTNIIKLHDSASIAETVRLASSPVRQSSGSASTSSSRSSSATPDSDKQSPRSASPDSDMARIHSLPDLSVATMTKKVADRRASSSLER